MKKKISKKKKIGKKEAPVEERVQTRPYPFICRNCMKVYYSDES